MALWRPNPVLLTDLNPPTRVSRAADDSHRRQLLHRPGHRPLGPECPFDPQCQRREDGNVTANSSEPKASAMQKLGCQAQFDTGFSVIVSKVRDRRYPIVDVERGLVYARGVLRSHGHRRQFPDGRQGGRGARRLSGGPRAFRSVSCSRSRRARSDRSKPSCSMCPYGMKSGWDTHPGARPRRAQTRRCRLRSRLPARSSSIKLPGGIAAP